MSTILITGGAGSVGREVAIRLALRGHRVRVFDLPACDYGIFAQVPGVEIIRGDIRDCDLLRHTVAGVDAVIHLAALLPPASERSREATMAINVEGTANVVAALEQASPNAHLILSSSVCVYGDTSHAEPPIGVSFPTRALDLYAESKVAAERLVMAASLPHTVLRISGISVPAFLEPPPVWPFMPGQRLEFVCRNDVVAALVACAEVCRRKRDAIAKAQGTLTGMTPKSRSRCWAISRLLLPAFSNCCRRPSTRRWRE